MKTTAFSVALLAVAQAVLGAPAAEKASEAQVLTTEPDFPLAELEAWYSAKLADAPDADVALETRQYSIDTFNQLTDGTPCRAVTLIYARGTTQAGNVGDRNAVGPLFFNALASRIGADNLAVQGVAYAANIAGFFAGGDATGSRTMAQLAQRAVTQCPKTKIVLSGYSQGAQLVHNAAGQISAAVTERITAVLTFGDPKNGQRFGSIPAARTKIICRSGDNICEGGILPTGPHTQYQQNVAEAATWVAGQV